MPRVQGGCQCRCLAPNIIDSTLQRDFRPREPLAAILAALKLQSPGVTFHIGPQAGDAAWLQKRLGRVTGSLVHRAGGPRAHTSTKVSLGKELAGLTRRDVVNSKATAWGSYHEGVCKLKYADSMRSGCTITEGTSKQDLVQVVLQPDSTFRLYDGVQIMCSEDTYHLGASPDGRDAPATSLRFDGSVLECKCPHDTENKEMRAAEYILARPEYLEQGCHMLSLTGGTHVDFAVSGRTLIALWGCLRTAMWPGRLVVGASSTSSGSGPSWRRTSQVRSHARTLHGMRMAYACGARLVALRWPPLPSPRHARPYLQSSMPAQTAPPHANICRHTASRPCAGRALWRLTWRACGGDRRQLQKQCRCDPGARPTRCKSACDEGRG